MACRRFAERFTVLIPYRAHSAATLIGLGADELVFGPIGELTQVDPSIRTDFTPPSTQAGTNLLVAVEDLTAYFDFMRETVRIGPEDARAAVDLLREKLHPLAIGQAFRSGRSVEYVAQHLLMLHMGDQEKAARIARSLVTELHVHAHRITLEEAQELGLPARAASTEEDQAMWKLYEGYEAEMQLEQPLRPTTVFPNVTDSLVELKDLRMVYVESADAADLYSMDLVAVRTQSQQFPAG
ncbi:hypothetical protein B1B_15405, partial [mine drainage metagenome]